MALSVGMTTTWMCLYGSMSLSVCVVVARLTRTCTFAQLTSRLSTATTCCLILLQLLPAALDEPAFSVLLCAQLLPMLLMLCVCHMASVWLFHIYFIICCGLHFQQGHCAIIMIFTYNHTFSKHIYGYLFLMFSFDRIIIVVLVLLLLIIIHLMCIMTYMRTDGQTDT